MVSAINPDLVFPAWPSPVLPVLEGSAAAEGAAAPPQRPGFPVRRLLCVARNYAAHAEEMGFDAREVPFFFLKSLDSLLPCGPAPSSPHEQDEEDSLALLPFPPATAQLHHEIELVVAIHRDGEAIDPGAALAHVFGYGVGLDMTRRDLQAEAREKGRPWDAAKSFEGAAPVSALVPAERCGHPREGRIWLDVNGARRQEGNLNQLIWRVPEILAHVSKLFPLRAGDLVFTGTPAGVSAVGAGDRLVGGVDGLTTLAVMIGPPGAQPRPGVA